MMSSLKIYVVHLQYEFTCFTLIIASHLTSSPRFGNKEIKKYSNFRYLMIY